MISIFGAEAYPTAAYVIMMGENDEPNSGDGDDDKIEPDDNDEGDNEDTEENGDNDDN